MKFLQIIIILLTFSLFFGCTDFKEKDKLINDLNNENILIKFDLNITKEEINNLTKIISIKDKNILLLSSFLNEKDNNIKNLYSILNEKESNIINKDNTISSLNTTISDKDNTISSLNTTISDKDNTISTLNIDVTNLNISNQLLEDKYNNALIEIDDLNSSFIRIYSYYLDGVKKDINILVYGRYNDYFKKFPNWYSNPTISREEYITDIINNSLQQRELLQIVNHFNSLNVPDKNKVRALVSFVQNIDYFAGKDIRSTNWEMYPYQVVYSGIGVCGEKSMLLILLLKEMGYKTAYISIHDMSHGAVGIGCQSEFSYKNSEYCYIESTSPNIISDYNNNSALNTIDYDIYPMSDGNIYDAAEDYNAQYYFYTEVTPNYTIEEDSEYRRIWGLWETDCSFGEEFSWAHTCIGGD
jgi:hypothetical protein